MKKIDRVCVELTIDERKTLLKAQKIWQKISDTFNESGVDISLLTNSLDDGLKVLLNCCEIGMNVKGE